MTNSRHNYTQEIFVTSDLHLGHKKMLEERSIFFSTEIMNIWLAKQWNKTVSEESIVYVLGDVSFMNLGKTKEWFDGVKGHVKFLKGNHDSSKDLQKLADHIDGELVDPIYEIAYTDYDGNRIDITLCHFPLASWNKSDYGSINLHGHLHGTEHHFCDPYTGPGTRIDIGVDCSEKLGFGKFEPIALRRLI